MIIEFDNNTDINIKTRNEIKEQCVICLELKDVISYNYKSNSCRCTIKPKYCKECILKWHAIKNRVICPLCKEHDRNPLEKTISDDDKKYMLNYIFENINNFQIENKLQEGTGQIFNLDDIDFYDHIDNHDDPIFGIVFKDVQDLLFDCLIDFYVSVKENTIVFLKKMYNDMLKHFRIINN